MSPHFYGFPSIATTVNRYLSVDNSIHRWGAISRLTPELLGYILYLSSAGSNPDSLRYLGVTGLRTSHVCRYWRQITMACKHIWQGTVLSWSLHSSSFEFVKTIIKRSSPLPLDIIIPEEMVPILYPEVMQELREQDRTRSLHIHLSSALISGVVRQTRRRPIARLPTRRGVGQNDGSVHRQPLVPINSQSIPPQPQKEASRFPSLKLLSPGQECFAPIAILMDCVRGSATLEVLRISGHPEDESDVPIFDSRVELPEVLQLAKPCVLSNLQELSVAAPIPTCASLVRNIAMPPTCAIQLTCYNANDARLNQYREILYRMQQSMGPWQCEPEYECSGRQTLYVSATHVGFSLEGPDLGELLDHIAMPDGAPIHPKLTLILDWRQSESPFNDLAVMLARLLVIFAPRRRWPTTLAVNADNSIPITRVVRGHLVEWLAHHQDFQALEFKTFDAFVLLEPVFRLRNNNRAITNAIVPWLSELTFYEIVYTPMLAKTWRRLVRGLHRRENAWNKKALTQIEFIDCAAQARAVGMENTWKEMIGMLVPFVDDIIVDGKDIDYSLGRIQDDETGYDTDSTAHQDSDIEL